MATRVQLLRHFHRAVAAFAQYHAAHDALVWLLETLVNVHERLASLQTPCAFSRTHACAHDIAQVVYTQQVSVVEELHQKLGSQMCVLPDQHLNES